MDTLILTPTYKKLHRFSLWVLLIVCIVSLFPAGYVVGDELGGYISEKLLSRSGVADSNLVIGGSSQSELDIGRNDVEGIPPTHMNATDPAYRITNLIPLVLMALFIYILLKVMATQELNVVTLLIIAVGIYTFYALIPGIRETITALLGGS